MQIKELLEIDNKNLQIIASHLKTGVLFVSTHGVVIGKNVKIEKGTKIYPGTILEGEVTIGEGCILGPNTYIRDSSIGSGSTINSSQINESTVGSHVTIGPFVHLRPGSEIESQVKIGNFVEVKNSKIGKNTSLSHLSYIGDSSVGQDVNIGCGTVTVNYDGKNKHSCIIEDDAFIGCQTALVAPVTVKKGGYTAAGSTITQDVPENSLAIARSRQVNKLGHGAGRFKK